MTARTRDIYLPANGYAGSIGSGLLTYSLDMAVKLLKMELDLEGGGHMVETAPDRLLGQSCGGCPIEDRRHGKVVRNSRSRKRMQREET